MCIVVAHPHMYELLILNVNNSYLGGNLWAFYIFLFILREEKKGKERGREVKGIQQALNALFSK